MAVAEARNDDLVGTTCPVNTDHATCGHRACKAFTGALAALKSSLAGVAVVTRPRAPGLPGQAAPCGPSTAPATVRAPEWMKPPTCGLHQRRHALRKQRHARRRSRPRSKDRGPSFHGKPHLSRGRGLPSSRFDPRGPKHPRRGTMFPDGSGVPLRFTKENCHVCKPSNESATARRRAARRVGTRPCTGSAATASGRPAAPCRGVRVHSSASRLVSRPDTRSTRPIGRVPRPTANDADFVGDLPTRGVHRLPSGCRCARRPRSPPC